MRASRVGTVLLTVVLAAAACAPTLEPAAPDVQPSAVPEVGEPAPAEPSGGLVRVAVPAEAASWLAIGGEPVAAADLAALWGLPLYHLDGRGRHVRALVEEAEVAPDGRQVELRLRAGEWSDGEPVTADDLAATVTALRGEPAAGLGWLAEVEVTGERTAILHLAHPSRRWPDLLGTVGVLPSHVLEDDGLVAFEAALPVTGGPFRLATHEPGLGATFEAHPDGPLGPPGLDEVEIVVVPSFDTALGLYADGDLDAVIGHLAVAPERRVEALETPDGHAPRLAAPLGGTLVGLRWRRDGPLGGEASLRTAVAAAVDVTEQVEAFDLGEPTASFVPALERPGPGTEVEEPDLEGLDVTVVVGREQEGLSATARLLEAQVRRADGQVRFEGLPTPQDVERAGELDGTLGVRREPPWPDLSRLVGDRDVVTAADRAVSSEDPAVVAALDRVADEAWERVLYRARVTHVWHPRMVGIEPSAWPGTGLASAHRWRLDEGG